MFAVGMFFWGEDIGCCWGGGFFLVLVAVEIEVFWGVLAAVGMFVC